MRFLQPVVGTKPLFLCLAGNLCSPAVFDKIQVPTFMQKVYVDYLAEPGPWEIHSIGANLVSRVRNFGGLPVIVAAYSAGGVVAMSAVSQAPELFAGLVLSSTGPCSLGHGDPNFPQELKDNIDNEVYMRKFLSSCFYHPISKEMENVLWEYTRTLNKEAGYDVSRSLRQEDYRILLKRFKNPVAIIHGKFDNRRKLDAVELLKESLPQAAVTLLNTGHTPMWEDSEGYQKALDSLLKKALPVY